MVTKKRLGKMFGNADLTKWLFLAPKLSWHFFTCSHQANSLRGNLTVNGVFLQVKLSITDKKNIVYTTRLHIKNHLSRGEGFHYLQKRIHSLEFSTRGRVIGVAQIRLNMRVLREFTPNPSAIIDKPDASCYIKVKQKQP